MDDGLIFGIAIPDVRSVGFDPCYTSRTKPDERMVARGGLGDRDTVLPRFDVLVDLAMRGRAHHRKHHVL